MAFKKKGYVHLSSLGQDAPFGFMSAPLPSDTSSWLKNIFYLHNCKIVLEPVFFVPQVKNEAIFDGFAYDAEKCVATVFQATVGAKHSVKTAGLEWLKGLGVKKVYYVDVRPVGQSLDLTV